MYSTPVFWVFATVYQVAAVSQVTHSFITPYSLCRKQWLDYLVTWKPAFGHKTRAFKGFISDTDVQLQSMVGYIA